MSYTTTYINRVLSKREFDNEAIPVSPAFYAELEIVTAHHQDSGAVFKLDYSTANGFIDSNDKPIYEFDDIEYVRSYNVKPRGEQEKFVKDYHTATMQLINDRGNAIKNLVSGL